MDSDQWAAGIRAAILRRADLGDDALDALIRELDRHGDLDPWRDALLAAEIEALRAETEAGR